MSDAKAELAPTGALRAGINLSNLLLVSGKSRSGDPVGVAPDMAREIATRLGVAVQYVTFATPGELADAASSAPSRGARKRSRSRRPMSRSRRPSAYDLWLICRREARCAGGPEAAPPAGRGGAARRAHPRRPLTAVQQAIGTPRANQAGADFLNSFVAEAKSSGLVAKLIERHEVRGLTVAA